MLTREYRGLAGAGGVKDVSRELAESTARAGLEVSVLMPRYGFMRPEERDFEDLGPAFDIDLNYAGEERRERVTFWYRKMEGVDLVLVEADRFGEKLGVYTYTDAEEAADPSHRRGSGHYDFFAMNCLLQKAALNLAIFTGTRPDVFHCQDGHNAILPAMMRELEGMRNYFLDSGALVTIHNAGIGYHQEVADLPFARANTGLPWKVVYASLLNGAFDPFLAGAAYAPVNTVSENYARELQETELDAMTGWLGHALRERGIRLEGITNGINPGDFDPRNPERLGLPAAFDPLDGDLGGKAIARGELVTALKAGELGGTRAFGTLDHRPGQPLLTAVSRLTEQKGVDVLASALDGLLAEDTGFQVLILGAGSAEIEAHLTALAGHPAYAERMAVLIGYEPRLANLIYAAGDFFVIPSRYEPCGLTDFMAQLMANIPIVRSTGGLVKVRDGFNGFAYSEHSPIVLAKTIQHALSVYRESPEKLRRMQINAIHNIQENFTWDVVREHYLKLYRLAREVQVG